MIWRWLVTIILYLSFVTTLLVFEVAFRFSLLTGFPSKTKLIDSLHSSMCWLVINILGAKISIKSETLIDPTKSYLFISNHQSMFDLCLLYNYLAPARPAFVPKKELSKWIPAISYTIRNDGSAIIDRKNPKQAIRALKDLGRRMNQQGLSAVIFPEGTRSKDGSLGRYKYAGIASILKESPDTIVVPIYMDGLASLLPGSSKPANLGVKLNFFVGKAIDPTTNINPKELCNEIEIWAHKQKEFVLQDKP